MVANVNARIELVVSRKKSKIAFLLLEVEAARGEKNLLIAQAELDRVREQLGHA